MDKRYIDFLKKYKANLKKHSEDRYLLEHLIGTYNLLKYWGMRKNVCVAGLFHSVYGNEYFTDKVLDIKDRRLIIDLIGEEAELLVYYFNISDREKTLDNFKKDKAEIIERESNQPYTITQKQFLDLVIIIFANALEQMPQVNVLSKYDAKYLVDLYKKCKPYINKAAKSSYQNYLKGCPIYI